MTEINDPLAWVARAEVGIKQSSELEHSEFYFETASWLLSTLYFLLGYSINCVHRNNTIIFPLVSLFAAIEMRACFE
jgi:hypothetical protein